MGRVELVPALSPFCKELLIITLQEIRERAQFLAAVSLAKSPGVRLSFTHSAFIEHWDKS